jgi:hypothetical protein
MTDGDHTPEQRQPGGVMYSVSMAFNLGVAFLQQGAGRSIVDVASELRDIIYNQIKRSYGEQYDEAFIQANTEYFLQIALLGYIIPSVCTYEEDFKTRLFELIERKLTRRDKEPLHSENPNIVIP